MFVVPCCLKYVVCQIFDPSGVVVIEVESCCVPYSYDLDTPFVAGEWCSLLIQKGEGGIGEIGSWGIQAYSRGAGMQYGFWS